MQIDEQIKQVLQKIINNFGYEANVVLTPSKSHADYSTNLAMVVASKYKLDVIDFATKVVEQIDKDKLFLTKIEVVKPGFINFFVSNTSYANIVNNIILEGENFANLKQNKVYNVEFVSANPTGYLHLGHVRSAAIGAILANVLEHAGNKVIREYYINDNGVQIDNLAKSLFARYQQIFNPNFAMPEDGYFGQDIIWAAQQVFDLVKDKYQQKSLENEGVLSFFKETGTKIFLEEIKKDLAQIGIHFDVFSSEKKLYQDKKIDNLLSSLKHTYKKDDALWLETTKFGDDKDRVLIKQDGTYTYFTPDITYHLQKLQSNNPDKLINVWGADHIGYVQRMKSALSILGYPNKVDFLIYQLVKLIKNNQELKMSKRRGTSFTLKDLLELCSKDAIRYFMINRSENTNLDFDLDQANQISDQNPVYIIQYSYARIAQLLLKSEIKEYQATSFFEENEIKLINILKEFNEIIATITKNYKINLLNQYLLNLAKTFNSFYSNSKIIGNPNEKNLLALVKATGIILKIGLKLIGVSIKERM